MVGTVAIAAHATPPQTINSNAIRATHCKGSAERTTLSSCSGDETRLSAWPRKMVVLMGTCLARQCAVATLLFAPEDSIAVGPSRR